MKESKRKCGRLGEITLFTYVIILFCSIFLFREASDKDYIRTELFWGYKSTNEKILYGDNLTNILLFVPIGFLVGWVVSRYKLIKAVLVGLFLSETIECSQLIWHRGTFDVDDLFNNTVGALVGGLIAVVVTFVKGRRNPIQT